MRTVAGSAGPGLRRLRRPTAGRPRPVAGTAAVRPLRCTSYVGHGTFHPGLVLRPAGSGRVHQRVVMRGEFGIGPVDLRVVEVRLVDPGLQVVRDESPRGAAEETEGFDVGLAPGVLIEVEDRADEHVPGGCEDHHECPDAVPGARTGVDPLPQEAVVDLCLGARLDLVTQHSHLRAPALLGQGRLDPAAQ
jgi:hypothetical protein